MDITDLKQDERGFVEEVACAAALERRLRSLHICKGEMVRLLKVSFFKKTYLVQAGGSRIALRREVAACVHIRKI